MNRIMRNLTIGAIASAAIAATSLTPVFGYADGNGDQVVEASKAGDANPNLQLSQDGYDVIRNVRAARLAIFNGDIEAANKYIDQAQTALTKAKSDDNVVKSEGDAEDAKWIPIDGQLVVADNFVATPEKMKHITAGNQKIKEGNSKEAIEELKLANVDIGFTRILMPLDETEAHVKLAADLIKRENYYEANMALKAAEDGLNIQTVMLTEAPKTGNSNAAATTQQPAKPEATQTN